MTKKQQKQPQKQKKQKTDWRRVIVAVLAACMALLLLLPMFTMILGGAGAVTQAEIDALKAEQSESKARQQELKEQLAAVKDDQAKAQQQRQILTRQLDAIQAEIDNIDQQIVYYDGEIAQKEEERLEAVAREEEQYALFCKRVRAMEEDGNVSYWSILFNAESFSDMLDRLADINDVMDYDNAVMEQLVETRRQIESIKADLESARAEQEDARAQQEAKKAEQQEKVAEAQKLLDQINADMAEVNRQLDAESAAAAEIQAEIAKKQKALAEERRKNNITIDTESNYMWPLPGYNRLTSAFGVPAPARTPILAAKSGQVVTSARHSSYGNYVVIDHGNGSSTLYAHMSSRNVTEGQMVKQGDVIGYVGTTGSSTGNHLHLEIRENYTRINPERKYTSMSFVRDY